MVMSPAVTTEQVVVPLQICKVNGEGLEEGEGEVRSYCLLDVGFEVDDAGQFPSLSFPSPVFFVLFFLVNWSCFCSWTTSLMMLLQES